MTDSIPHTIPGGAMILITLRQKPREQIHFKSEDMPLLRTLLDRGLADYIIMSSLPEQSIWTITPAGLTWLEMHGL